MLLSVFGLWVVEYKRDTKSKQPELYKIYVSQCTNAAFMFLGALAFSFGLAWCFLARKEEAIYFYRYRNLPETMDENGLKKGLIRFRNRLSATTFKMSSLPGSFDQTLNTFSNKPSRSGDGGSEKTPAIKKCSPMPTSVKMRGSSSDDYPTTSRGTSAGAGSKSNIRPSNPGYEETSFMSLTRSTKIGRQYTPKHAQARTKSHALPCGEINTVRSQTRGDVNEEASGSCKKLATKVDDLSLTSRKLQKEFPKPKSEYRTQLTASKQNPFLSASEKDDCWSSSSGSLEAPRSEIDEAKSDQAIALGFIDEKLSEEIQISESNSDATSYVVNSSDECLQKSEFNSGCVHDVRATSGKNPFHLNSDERVKNYDDSDSDSLIELDFALNFKKHIHDKRPIYRKIFDTVKFFKSRKIASNSENPDYDDDLPEVLQPLQGHEENESDKNY